MADLLRVGLRTATIVTIGATGWLVSVLVTIVPARDPRSEPFVDRHRGLRGGRRASPRCWPRCAGNISVGPARCSPCPPLGRRRRRRRAGIDSQAELPDGGHGEGYLLALGLILAVQGLLGLGVARSPSASAADDERRAPVDLDRIVSLAEFEPLARAAMDPRAFDYVAGGAWDELSLGEAEAAWRRRRLRPRVLVDVSRIDPSTTMAGSPAALPLAIAPMAAHALAHPDAELATARAAAAAGIPFTLSTMSTRLDRGGRRGRSRWDELVPALHAGRPAADAEPRRASGGGRLPRDPRDRRPARPRLSRAGPADRASTWRSRTATSPTSRPRPRVARRHRRRRLRHHRRRDLDQA